MALTSEVQPCPNMAMRGLHTLWVTTDRKEDNTKIAKFISWQIGPWKEMTILIGSLSDLNFEIQTTEIEHSLIIINFAQLSFQNSVYKQKLFAVEHEFFPLFSRQLSSTLWNWPENNVLHFACLFVENRCHTLISVLESKITFYRGQIDPNLGDVGSETWYHSNPRRQTRLLSG